MIPSNSLITVDGGVFKLRDGLDLEAVKAQAADAERRAALLCRSGWRGRKRRHNYKAIADPHFPEDDLVAATLTLLVTSDYGGVVQCQRCGALARGPRC